MAITVVLLAGSARAWGHAAFVSSQPEPGSQLPATPGVVTLTFSEPLIAELSSVTVVAPTGEEFVGGPAAGETVIRVEVTSTARGEYTVRWKTVSPLDGHTLTGAFGFGVGVEVEPDHDATSAPTLADLLVGVGRAVEYVGLLAILGWLTLSALARSAEVGWVPGRLERCAPLARRYCHR